MPNLNKEERIIGACTSLALYPLLGLGSLILAVITSVLWALPSIGKSKATRRVGVSVLLSLAVYGLSKMGIAVGAYCFGVLSLGYGIPTTQPSDEGAILGRFWYRLVKKEALAEQLTRLTTSLLLGLALVPYALVTGDWEKVLTMIAFIVISHITVVTISN